jgi:hypothetical protein
MRRKLGTLALLGVSLAFAAALAELVLRWRLDEVDYLQPRLEAHPILRHVIVPGSAGHDALGFRNPDVPERVDVLAIGDSQTYGVSAPARESWPAWLARMSGRSVYNLALGGYGPPDYHHLLREIGLGLAPEVVVVGFYFGNDLPRAGRFAEDRPQASRALRDREDPRRLGELRTWLAAHSVLYQAAKYELPLLVNGLRFREAAGRDAAIALEHPVSRTVLTPDVRLRALDQQRPRNRRGLEATLAELDAIQSLCRERSLRCLTLLIPTKESVYGELARESLDPESYARLARLVEEEQRVREALVRHLEARGHEWVDALPALRAAAGTRRLYAASSDGHPSGEGYRVIASAVLARLDREAPR